jgi:hypothetical protein
MRGEVRRENGVSPDQRMIRKGNEAEAKTEAESEAKGIQEITA